MSESLDYPLQKKTIIVQIDFAKGKANSSSENIFNEFKDLVVSSGAKIAYENLGKQIKPTSALFISKGRAERIRDQVQEVGSDLVIFNHDLSPSQERNLETLFKTFV